MSAKGTLWLMTKEAQKQFFSTESDEEKLKACFINYGEDVDLTSVGWMKAGTVEVTPNFSNSAEATRAAVAAVDEQIRLLETEFRVNLHRLREYKSTLLCLEAPK